MSTLTQKKCQPCEGTEKALTLTQAKEFLSKVSDWKIDSEGKSIHRDYSTKNFNEAINFINKVAKIAEDEQHHPNLHLTSYRNLRIELSTHAIKGLSEIDFILAAKINELPILLKNK